MVNETESAPSAQPSTTAPVGVFDDPSLSINNPALGAVGFLRACMHEPRLPLHVRIRAAELLMALGPNAVDQDRVGWHATVRIGGRGLH
jgi:hypothetical protein